MLHLSGSTTQLAAMEGGSTPYHPHHTTPFLKVPSKTGNLPGPDRTWGSLPSPWGLLDLRYKPGCHLQCPLNIHSKIFLTSRQSSLSSSHHIQFSGYQTSQSTSQYLPQGGQALSDGPNQSICLMLIRWAFLFFFVMGGRIRPDRD